nr:hypothetical protein [Tanacetum cinerariifolium]
MLMDVMPHSFFPDLDDDDDYDYDFSDFDDTKINRSQDEEKEVRKDTMLVRLSKWRKARAVDAPRLYEKAPKIVNVNVKIRSRQCLFHDSGSLARLVHDAKQDSCTMLR